ncbi:MAG: PQQ-binding-like beta-propeller repeat protein [Gemmatimonadales bacterium]|nr:PQQ-binding-like beta-propeller repeat protein [Gemmatimonadales bacterium]
MIAGAVPSCARTTEPDEPRVIWRHSEPRGAQNSPLVDRGQVVFTLLRSPVVVALDEGTGVLRWEQTLPVPNGTPGSGIPPEGGAVAAGDLVFVPAGDVFALDGRTGRIEWVFSKADDFPGLGKLLVHDGRLYAAGRRLYALDPSTGSLLWEREMGDRVADPVGANASVLVFSRQLISGTNVLGPARLHALNSATGADIWQTEVSEQGIAVSAPTRPAVTAAGLVIVATADGRVVALSEATGSVRWIYRRATDLRGGVVAIESTAVTGGLDGRVIGLDLDDGGERWSAVFGAGSGASIVNLITVGAAVCYAVSGRIEAYSPAGALLWGHGGAAFGEPIYTTPVRESAGVVYVGAEDGLYALRAVP